jgi:hypothetical protein
MRGGIQRLPRNNGGSVESRAGLAGTRPVLQRTAGGPASHSRPQAPLSS